MKVNPELFKAIVGGLFDKHKRCNYLNCDMKTIESFALSKVGLCILNLLPIILTKSLFHLKWNVEDVDFFSFSFQN